MKKRQANKSKGIIFVISGPSGSGKTTLAQKILEDKDLDKKVIKSISYTTRPRRSMEKPGRDYFFVKQARFEEERKAKKILEWTRYLGYYYGTPRRFVDKVLKAGKSVILCVDLKGAFRLKKLYPDNSLTIFILPPSLAVLRERMLARCKNVKPAEIQRRLELAEKEILSADSFDYGLVNKDFKKALKKLKKIILGKIERLKNDLCSA